MKQIPPPGKGSLYIRPLLMGSGPVLGLGPAPECTFLIYASPVGNYFKVGFLILSKPGFASAKARRIYVLCWFILQEGLAPLNLFIDDEYHRATRGGAGGVKTITNYSPVSESVSHLVVK